MNRVEKFKELRKKRKRYFLAALLFLSLLAVGLPVTDYSVNSLLSNEKKVNIFSIFHAGTSYEVDVMQHKIQIDVKYILRDYQKLKDYLAGFFQSR